MNIYSYYIYILSIDVIPLKDVIGHSSEMSDQEKKSEKKNMKSYLKKLGK